MSDTARTAPTAPAEPAAPASSLVFAPVASTTTFEETLERLGNAIKLGLLAPGTRLPPERDLCEQMEIARSTLRQALRALVESGHLHAVRGRGGGTFVSDPPPAADPPSAELIAAADETCARRLAVELGVAALAAERATPEAIALLDELVAAMDASLRDFPTYRQADVRFHVALAETAGSTGLLVAMAEVQGAMSDLIAHIAHPPEVLAWSNAQHARLVAALERHDAHAAVGVMIEHLRGTERVIAGLMPQST